MPGGRKRWGAGGAAGGAAGGDGVVVAAGLGGDVDGAAGGGGGGCGEVAGWMGAATLEGNCRVDEHAMLMADTAESASLLWMPHLTSRYLSKAGLMAIILEVACSPKEPTVFKVLSIAGGTCNSSECNLSYLDLTSLKYRVKVGLGRVLLPAYSLL